MDSRVAIIALAIVLILIVSAVGWRLAIIGTDNADNPHSPIVIDGDDDLVLANGVTSGSGTAEDPYLIEDWEIEIAGGVAEYGISISSVSCHVTIQGVTVYSSGFNQTEGYHHASGIYLVSVVNCTIVDCKFRNLEVGIDAYDLDGMGISSNSFESCDRCVASSGQHWSNSIRNSTIESNTMRNCESPLEIVSAWNITVRANVFEDPHVAVFLQNVREANLHENIIRGSSECAVWIWGGNCCSISGNTVQSSSSSGIRLYQVGYSVVANNSLESMQVSLLATDCIDVVVEHNLLTGGSSDASLNCGLKVIDSTGVVVRFNAVENNLLGVVLAASNTSLMDVVVYHNNLRLNVVHAIDNCGSENQWDNGYPDGGNYWAGVIVTDVDGDGIGDEEHYIDSDSVDRYPLIAPLSL